MDREQTGLSTVTRCATDFNQVAGEPNGGKNADAAIEVSKQRILLRSQPGLNGFYSTEPPISLATHLFSPRRDHPPTPNRKWEPDARA